MSRTTSADRSKERVSLLVAPLTRTSRVRLAGWRADVSERRPGPDGQPAARDVTGVLRAATFACGAAATEAQLLADVAHAILAAEWAEALSVVWLQPHAHVVSYVRNPLGGMEEISGLARAGCHARISAPIAIGGALVGVIELETAAGAAHEPSEQQALEMIGMQLASALERLQLRQECQAARQTLERVQRERDAAYEATIEGWARALELRDSETEGHSRRVTDLTVCLARALGVAEEQIVHIRRGALLHDIGKIGVPDRFLFNAGPLSDEGWERMRRHPRHAVEMLAAVTYLEPALDIPHYHHEKWDGSGYPHGLAGEQIPLAARIFAVVDVWDALTSDRPYRSAWSEERALAYIRDESGTSFDPRVVGAFFDVLGAQAGA